jgi:hypothetical protein
MRAWLQKDSLPFWKCFCSHGRWIILLHGRSFQFPNTSSQNDEQHLALQIKLYIVESSNSEYSINVQASERKQNKESLSLKSQFI